MESSIDDAIDYLIIQFIKKEPFMYDKRHVHYLQKNERKVDLFETVSQTIFQEFHYNLSVGAIEKRWNDLLKKHGNEKEKLRVKPKSGSGANCATEKWVLFDDMAFLDEPILKHRKVTSSISTMSKNSEKRSAKTDKMPMEDSFTKKKRKEVARIDSEIAEMKGILKDAIRDISKPSISHPSKVHNTQEDDTFLESVRKGLQQVPIKNLLDCMIHIKEITKKYENEDKI